MEINYLAVVVCAILSMGLGFLWFGAIFGKRWMELTVTGVVTPEERSVMMKRANKFYIVQFVLSLFQIWILAYYIAGWNNVSGLENALWIWAAFVMPTIVGNIMWNNGPKGFSWPKFLIQAGYQLVLFAVLGIILGIWR